MLVLPAGVKGGRSPAKRTLDAGRQHIRCRMADAACWRIGHAKRAAGRMWPPPLPHRRFQAWSTRFVVAGSRPTLIFISSQIVFIEDTTVEGQTAHLQAGLCRRSAPRPQIRTARQDSIRSACSKHVRLTEFTCRRS